MAQAQRGQNDRRDHQDQRAQVSPPDQRRQGDDDRRRVAEPQQRRAAQEDAQRRDVPSRQREHQEQIERAQQAERTERAERAAREERLEQARRRAELNRAYDRDRDYRPGYDYRYNVGGVYRETNQYGVDALRRAVDLGYQQGYRAGQTDRRDGAPADFRRAFEYQNGNYGFNGNYVPESDYSYYFREGFQRGYDDAYWSRARYGTFSNGNPSILGDILSGILGLTSIR
jgi:hypothetical protein